MKIQVVGQAPSCGAGRHNCDDLGCCKGGMRGGCSPGWGWTRAGAFGGRGGWAGMHVGQARCWVLCEQGLGSVHCWGAPAVAYLWLVASWAVPPLQGMWQNACGKQPTPSHPCSRCHPCPPPAGRPYLATSLLGLAPLPPTPVPVSEAAARDAEARLRLGATPSEAALDAQDLVGEGGRGGTGGGDEEAGAEQEEEEGEEEGEGLGAGPRPIASMTSEGELAGWG